MIQYVTKAGIDAMASVMSSGSTLTFTRCSVGSGAFNPKTMTPKAMTALLSEIASVPVKVVSKDETGVSITADVDNKLLSAGARISEMGVWALAGNSEVLFAYAYSTDPEVVPPASESFYERRFTSHIAMSESELSIVITADTFEDAVLRLTGMSVEDGVPMCNYYAEEE